MTLRTADRVRDTTTTTGTGTLTISGTPPIGHIAYSAIPSIAAADTFLALIAHRTLGEWEVSLCTYNSATAIARTTVLSSSNAGALVNFSAGTKDVVLVQTSEREVLINDIQVPLVCGGDGAASTLTLQSTSGAGTTDAILFKTGSQVERMRIDTNGCVVFNMSGTAYAAPNATHPLAVIGSTADCVQGFWAYGSTNAPGTISFNYTPSNTSHLTQSPVQSGYWLGLIGANGSDGAAFQEAARIMFIADATFSAGSSPGRLGFYTTPVGSVSFTERMRIDSAGKVSILTTTGSTSTTTGALTVMGGVGISQDVFVLGGVTAYMFKAASQGFEGTGNAKNSATVAGGLSLRSNDVTDRLESYVQLYTAVTATDRRLVIGCLEQNVSWRNISIAESGGNVGIGNANPAQKLDVVGHSIFTPSSTPPTLATNGNYNLTPTSNTNMRISHRGSDGVTRVANITLA
jgi:hypothetical protein